VPEPGNDQQGVWRTWCAAVRPPAASSGRRRPPRRCRPAGASYSAARCRPTLGTLATHSISEVPLPEPAQRAMTLASGLLAPIAWLERPSRKFSWQVRRQSSRPRRWTGCRNCGRGGHCVGTVITRDRPGGAQLHTWVAAIAAQGGELAAAAAARVPEAGAALGGAHGASGGGGRQGLCPGAPSRRRTLRPAGSCSGAQTTWGSLQPEQKPRPRAAPRDAVRPRAMPAVFGSNGAVASADAECAVDCVSTRLCAIPLRRLEVAQPPSGALLTPFDPQRAEAHQCVLRSTEGCRLRRPPCTRRPATERWS